MNTSSAKRIPRSVRRIRAGLVADQLAAAQLGELGAKKASGGGAEAAQEVGARDALEPAQAQVEVLAARLGVRDGLVLDRGRLAAQRAPPRQSASARAFAQPPLADE